MCAAGMVWAGISRIVFAAAGADIAALAPSRPRFSLSCADVVAASGEAVLVRGPVDGVGALDPFRG
jgi:tRNA(Arg) A34 adenosine deaminase TadA